MKGRILIVDDDQNLIDSLRRELKEEMELYHIDFAKNGREALEKINKDGADLLITDIRMPEMDGISLLVELMNSKKWMHVIVASGENTMRMMNLKSMEELKDFGIVKYIYKPFLPSSFKKLLRETMEKIEQSDTIRGITLPSILQMVEMDGVTGVITVQKGKMEGRLFFRWGGLVDAQTENLNGEKAALDILSWKDVKVSIEHIHHNRKKTIKLGLVSLILKASKEIDEKRKIS